MPLTFSWHHLHMVAAASGQAGNGPEASGLQPSSWGLRVATMFAQQVDCSFFFTSY